MFPLGERQYERVYLPTVEAIHAERLGEAARKATEELARERRGVRGLLRRTGAPPRR
jgi:hypothetical protein